MSNYTNDDFARVLAETESLRRQIAGLKKATIAGHAAAVAAEHLGGAERAPLLAEHLRADVADDGNVSIVVIDAQGRPRTTFDTKSMRFAEVTPTDLAGELKSKWPRLVSNIEPAATDDAATSPKSDDDLLEQLRRKATAERNADQADFLARVQKENPFRVGPSFNLTDQMRLHRVNPVLAGKLKSAAEDR